ncbi:unnamed protein product [Hermetia illucens]|uniref:Methyltransferase type 11 domain-containing protein n=1 Tax=Hermetia illucens TaxID=343691 RepID=A0A7R8UDV1_HERIL|nr:eEF1A lysine and N-terminal methyltransferase homolog [Hermetia illucens]CAD7078893.1 unnamed protein product [Hermetia illucens]
MNLLPKTSQEFGQTEYWDTFFKKRGKKAFEWYGEYPELCDQLHKYIKVKDSVLMVGCGNSKLSMDMYDIGFRDITNIDISPVVIKQMLEVNRNQRSDMKFLQMDATMMTFPDESFSVALDKGTLDALMTDESEGVLETVRKYFSEVSRVLKNGGRYICISLLQEHILKFVLQYFPSNNCMLRIVRCFEAEQKTTETSTDGNVMPVFVLVATKFKMLPQKILEVCLGGDKMQRLQTTDELFEAITSIQRAALVCNGLSKNSISGLDEVRIDLFQPGTKNPRYTVHILDQPPARGNGKYAAFIVPQGREVEWLFSTPQGRKKLLETARHNRLAIVTMHRDQTYSSLVEVKSELAESVRNLSPHGIKEQIPFLSLGQDVGTREILHQGTTKFSGDFIVEEIEGENKKVYRRLVFLSNQSVIQSEALVKIIKPKSKPPKKKIDLGYLACQHHLYMTVGANYAVNTCGTGAGEILVIGLGGGGLCMFIHEVIRNSKLTAIDIDPVMLEISEKFFDLKQDNRLEVVIEDGIAYLGAAGKSNKQFNAILFDVDSKDLSLGMSCPPASFLEPTVLNDVKMLIGNKGVFVLNLVCRDETLREKVLNDLRSFFKSICSYKLDEDVNEIIYCTNYDVPSWAKALENASKDINNAVKQLKWSKDEMIDLSSFIGDLKI